jgi:hypothetical protein
VQPRRAKSDRKQRRRLPGVGWHGLLGLSCSSAHLVTKRHHAALIGFDLRKMKGDISVELLEEAGPITEQDRQDRITNFVG